MPTMRSHAVSYRNRICIPCLSSVLSNSDQLWQAASAALTASWIRYLMRSLPRSRYRRTLSFPLAICRRYSSDSSRQMRTLRRISFRSFMVFPSLSTRLATICRLQMRVCGIGMKAHDTLCVHNSYTPHIFAGYFRHPVGREPCPILNGEVQRDMIDGIRQLASRLIIRLPLHTSGYGGIAVQPYIFAVYQFRLFRVVGVVHYPCDVRPFLYIAHHNRESNLLNSSNNERSRPHTLGTPCWWANRASWFRLLQPPSSIRICRRSSCIRATTT